MVSKRLALRHKMTSSAPDPDPAPAEVSGTSEEAVPDVTPITIQRGRHLPAVKKCTSCCSMYHCPFCSASFYKPSKESKLHHHLKLHFSRAVVHEGYTIHRCGLACKEKLHYHCVYCSRTIFRHYDFVVHLKGCKMRQPTLTAAASSPNPDVPPPTVSVSPPNHNVPPSTVCVSSPNPDVPPSTAGTSPPNPDVPPSTAGTSSPNSDSPPSTVGVSSPIPDAPPTTVDMSPLIPDVPHWTVSMSSPMSDGPPSTVDMSSFIPDVSAAGTSSVHPQQRSRAVVKTMCPHCHITIHKKNFRKHLERKHAKPDEDMAERHHLYSECIDQANGVYTVQKTFLSSSVPVHVVYKYTYAGSDYVLLKIKR
ncbi:uncharacterized protein ACBR49_012641 isoform 2-T2 [Aulostomus maculatus]